MTYNTQEILNTIAQVIYDKKGLNIVGIDVKGIFNLTDYCMVASGNVDRHVKAMSHEIIEKVREMGLKPLYVDGGDTGEWIVIDYGEIIVHLLVPELRDRYRLEELWHDGKILNLELMVENI